LYGFFLRKYSFSKLRVKIAKLRVQQGKTELDDWQVLGLIQNLFSKKIALIRGLHHSSEQHS